MKDKNIQSFNEYQKNLNTSDVSKSNPRQRRGEKVTEIGQKFIVKLPTQIMRDSKFWQEEKVYTCTDIIKFDGLDCEIYVDDDNWISDSFTTVV